MLWQPGHMVGWMEQEVAKQWFVYKSPRVSPMGSVLLVFNNKIKIKLVKYLINTYVRYLSYALLIIAKLPNDELTGNHTLSLPPLYL